jgi:hypothetical protein
MQLYRLLKRKLRRKQHISSGSAAGTLAALGCVGYKVFRHEKIASSIQVWELEESTLPKLAVIETRNGVEIVEEQRC